MRFKKFGLGVLAVAAACTAGFSVASSHREAPFITTSPKVDGTDFYMFRSYEGIAANGTGGRSDYVTLIANYVPLQFNYGPNYFAMDENALYEIHIDNDGNAVEDLTFQFRFKNTLANVALPIGTGANQKMVAIPLSQAGAVANVNDANLNVKETYSVNVIRGDRRKGASQAVTKTSGSPVFEKPVDYIGVKTLGNAAAYETYATKHIHDIKIPGCPAGKDLGKVFVGQRQEGFAVNLGPVFDLVNATAAQVTNPALTNAFAANSIQTENVTQLAIEVHKDCLTTGSESVIGGWTTASLRQARVLSGNASSASYQSTEKTGGAWTQVSRLGNPLVNEVVIGLKDKNKFNSSKPSGDGQFLDYVTNPTLPALLGLVLAGDAAGLAPTNIPRTDLATVFLTGITGVNKPTNVKASEMLRLNTAIAPVQFADQNRLGVAGEVLRVGGLANLGNAKDLAGFPNGRRPKDDVVDIALVAMLGGLCVINGDNDGLKLNSIPGVAGVTSACKPSSVPLGATSALVHDGVDQALVPFKTTFPYLNTPNPGSK
jgi:Domain of unknown function (DUF4331)